MFEFAALPPEVNSGRMYTGPGSGPMLAAASAWDGLAAELYSTAASYASEISTLADGLWSGPSAVAMEKAAAPQVDWLSTTASQAERAASQARAAVGAYEAAFAMTVPPPVIAANRALLMALIATNFLGQNTPAIAATEAHYAEMWAQDATAMHSYAAAAAVHSTLTPFTSPPQDSNGGANQGATTLAQLGNSVASHVQSAMSIGPKVLSAGPQALQAVASQSATSSAPWWSTPTGIVQVLTQLVGQGPPPITGLFTNGGIGSSVSGEIFGSVIPMLPVGEISVGGMLGWPAYAQVPPVVAAMPAVGLSSASAPVSVGLGGGGQIGTLTKLSVPHGWTDRAPEVRLASIAETLPDVGAEAAAGDEMFAGMGGMPPMFGATPLVVAANGGKGQGGKASVEEPESPASGKRQRLPRHWR
ncbi:MAG TPA: PPE family protein [Mycobacterium sp.]|nr:PPE family protein [Mycobacterium sp.]